MSKIIVVVETGSDISEELKKKYGIYSVPMHVTFGNESRDDGTFPPQKVCEYYENTGRVPKTSGSTPYDYAEVFKRIYAEHPFAEILHLGYSAVTTSSFQSALLAKGNDAHIECVDTKNVSIGQCAAAIKVARLIRKNPEWTLKQAAEAAKCVCEHTKMMFVPDKLEYLKAGGRVKSGAALLGSILHIHPVIDIINGYLCVIRKIPGSLNRAISNAFSLFMEKYNPDTEEICIGGTPGFSDKMKDFVISVASEWGFKNINWLNAGNVITTHGGPNAFGIAGYCRENAL